MLDLLYINMTDLLTDDDIYLYNILTGYGLSTLWATISLLHSIVYMNITQGGEIVKL